MAPVIAEIGKKLFPGLEHLPGCKEIYDFFLFKFLFFRFPNTLVHLEQP